MTFHKRRQPLEQLFHPLFLAKDAAMSQGGKVWKNGESSLALGFLPFSRRQLVIFMWNRLSQLGVVNCCWFSNTNAAIARSKKEGKQQ